jgi:hypothetical protein
VSELDVFIENVGDDVMSHMRREIESGREGHSDDYAFCITMKL